MQQLNIEDLIVTQEDIRSMDNLVKMIEFVRCGGVFTKEEIGRHNGRKLIQISVFPDGKLYIHDGHHRILSIFLGGRDILLPEEYELTKWIYKKYLELNPEDGWFTPFDPRLEVRHADFHDFKKLAIAMTHTDEDMAKLPQFVAANKNMYCSPRAVEDSTTIDVYCAYHEDIHEAVNKFHKNNMLRLQAEVEGYLTASMHKYFSKPDDPSEEAIYTAGFGAGVEYMQRLAGFKEIPFYELEEGEFAIHQEYGRFKKIGPNSIELIDLALMFDEPEQEINDINMLVTIRID